MSIQEASWLQLTLSIIIIESKQANVSFTTSSEMEFANFSLHSSQTQQELFLFFMIWFPSWNTVGGNHERWLFKTSPWDFQLAKIRTCDFFACTEVIIEAAALKMKSVNLHGSRLVILGWCHILMSTYSLCISPQWLKITKNIAFFQKLSKIDHFW